MISRVWSGTNAVTIEEILPNHRAVLYDELLIIHLKFLSTAPKRQVRIIHL